MNLTEFELICHNNKSALALERVDAIDAKVGDVVFVNGVYALVTSIAPLNSAPTIKPGMKAEVLVTTNGLRYRAVSDNAVRKFP